LKCVLESLSVGYFVNFHDNKDRLYGRSVKAAHCRGRETAGRCGQSKCEKTFHGVSPFSYARTLPIIVARAQAGATEPGAAKKPEFKQLKGHR
jgi:hypothetical protein